MPKISVIVPIYNIEQYLPHCLDSILAQTLQDIEVICVDDGSTDNSGKIIDEYALLDKRLKALHRANAGYGAAMNAGLDAATGEYIGIVESDDCIEGCMYEQLWNAAEKYALDLVKSDAYYWLEIADYKKRIHCNWMEEYYDKVLDERYRNRFFDFMMNIWTGIYRRRFLLENQIRFHETLGASYQDNGFWMQTMLYCKRAMWLNQAFYLYRQDNPTASVKSPGKIMAMAKEYQYLEELLVIRGEQHFLPYCYAMRMFRHRGTFYRIADACKRDFCEHIKEDYSKYSAYIRTDRAVDNWLIKAVIAPDALCKQVISAKRRLQDRLENAKNIIIYGAGQHGDLIFRALYNEGYYDKISCFAISAREKETSLGKKRVCCIEDAVLDYPNALIIVAVIRGSGMYQEMVKKLKELGISDYMDGTEIEENFYIL